MKRNQRGGAALVAVLIMLILVAAGTAVMIVTGKGRIKEADTIPSITKDESSSAAEDDSSAASQAESKAEPVASEPDKTFPEPEKSADYKDVDFKKLGLSTKYSMLLDVEANEIVAGSNYEKKIYPASLTKLMTIIVAMENVKDPKAKYKFTDAVLDPLYEENASMAGFVSGETVTFNDLLYSSILVSGADGTSGLANMVAGSEKAFVELMNKKAAEMGLTGTHFTNASGLHDDNHYSTCKDMCILFSYAMQDKTLKKVLTTDTYTTSKTTQHEEGITLYSIVQSRFLGWYVDLNDDGLADGNILGGKTGFTDEASFCLEVLYEYEGKNYIGITCKSTYQLNSIQDTITLLEYYTPGSTREVPAASAEEESKADEASSSAAETESKEAADSQAETDSGSEEATA